jgi:hypothetical protein
MDVSAAILRTGLIDPGYEPIRGGLDFVSTVDFGSKRSLSIGWPSSKDRS